MGKIFQICVRNRGFSTTSEQLSQHRQLFDKLGEQLGYTSMEDWYDVNADKIRKNGGAEILLRFYRHSPSTALKTIYPDHDWMIWRFNTVPKSYWKNNASKNSIEQKRMIDWLGDKLGIHSVEDWLSVSYGKVRILHRIIHFAFIIENIQVPFIESINEDLAQSME